MQSIASIRDRAMGAFVGLAVGDALGAPVEFMRRDSFPPVTDYRDGGPFDLKTGEWTDDTSMALGLADALLEDPLLKTDRLARNWIAWATKGAFSHNGRCFDIGNQTSSALSELAQGKIPGPTKSAGNGAIMRLAPSVVCHWSTPGIAVAVAVKQTMLTHNNDECAWASTFMTSAMLDLLHRRKPSVNIPELTRETVKSTGYVIDTFNAAFWCLSQTDNFKDAVLLAVNLGDDSDTVGAVTGQLAGTKYGFQAIPEHWVRRLAWGDQILILADKLFKAGLAQHQHAA